MYMSVSEYALKTGKDKGNIRRMLIDGRIPGIKIGNQWVIDSTTGYTSDNRIKTGEFRFWRRKTALNRIPGFSALVRRIIDGARGVYGNRLLSVILYGSYSRGDQTDESDIDIAVILLSESDEKEIGLMTELAARTEIAFDRIISVVDIPIDKYNEYKNILPFYRNIDKEGIVLWKTK